MHQWEHLLTGLGAHSTWLEGAMLLASYIIIAMMYLYREGDGEDRLSCVCGQPCCLQPIPSAL